MAASGLEDTELLRLREEVAEKTREIERLKLMLAEGNDTKAQAKDAPPTLIESGNVQDIPTFQPADRLDKPAIARYSRQLILPELGVKGQLALCGTSVLLVGAGGLGCPAAVYLAAAGVGRLGLVDYDSVELNNLHRQVLHTEGRVGTPKALSVATAVKGLNSTVQCVPYHLQLNSTNALDVIKQYDIVVDCTDNVATRYLLNDACVFTNKPLVSGSALRLEGQLTVYNYKGGPCYRCMYPTPPPPETVTNCSDGGVLGVVPGIIGCLQALEVIKMAAGQEVSYSQRLLLFDALDGTFRSIKLRPRQASCVVCGDAPTVTQLQDYEQFCGAKACDKTQSLRILQDNERISVQEYHTVLSSGAPHLLVDVRQPVELDICQLPNPINIPISQVSRPEQLQQLKTAVTCKVQQLEQDDHKLPVYVVCRQGNDSQLAVEQLRNLLSDLPVHVTDIRGGLMAWARKIDTSFPEY
ncbi:adenylyltransferase and sulfurtransferase MOCS3-like isoform X2 [Branchiostoma floridae x Branchiostoma belcheri]